MEKRKIGKLEVSAVGLGCMGITHASGAPMSVKDGVKVVEQAYDMGYTLFGLKIGESEHEKRCNDFNWRRPDWDGDCPPDGSRHENRNW